MHHGRGLILCLVPAAAHPGPCRTLTLVPEHVPRLVIGVPVPACRRVSSSSRHLFLRRRTYLSSSSSRWSPRVGIYNCPGSLVVPSSQWACTVLVIVVAPGEVPPAALVARLSLSSSSSSTHPPPEMRTRRTRNGRRWSTNCRRQNQRCQLRAWNRWHGARWRPLCAWHRQGRSPKRREGQRNRISWPVVIIGLLDGRGPGTEMITHQMGLNWEFYEGNVNSYEENKMRKVGAKIQFCTDFTLCAKPAQDYIFAQIKACSIN